MQVSALQKMVEQQLNSTTTPLQRHIKVIDSYSGSYSYANLQVDVNFSKFKKMLLLLGKNKKLIDI